MERASASTAVSPVAAHHDLQQNEAALIGLKRKELPKPEPVIDSCMCPSKRVRDHTKKNGYRETIDGTPPKMNPNHVDFI